MYIIETELPDGLYYVDITSNDYVLKEEATKFFTREDAENYIENDYEYVTEYTEG